MRQFENVNTGIPFHFKSSFAHFQIDIVKKSHSAIGQYDYLAFRHPW